MKLLSKSSAKKFASYLFVAAAGLSLSFNALADDSWADALETGVDTLDAIKAFVVALSYTMGVIAFFGGIYLIYKDGKEEGRGHLKNGIIGVVLGSVMLVFPTAVGWSVISIGGDSSDLEIDITDEF